MRLLGRYLNSFPEVLRVRDLCSRAAGERIERTYSPPDRAVPRLTTSQNEEIVKLYKGGMRVADIARQIGTSEWTIHHRLNRMAVERRSRGMSEEAISRAVELRSAGMSFTKIGPVVGVSPNTVAKELRARGAN